MNVCRVFQEKKVNNSIAAVTEVKKLCTWIYGRTVIVLFVMFSFNTHAHTDDKRQRRKIITRKENLQKHTNI